MPRIKALLFDLDGTLTHTDPVHLRAIRHLMAEHGLSLSDEDFRLHVSGRSNVDIGTRLFPNHDAAEHVTLLDRKEALFRDFATDLLPLPGAVALMDEAQAAGLKIALVTNAPRHNVDHMLAAIGLAGRFDTIVYGDEMTRPKPDPLPYLTGLQRLGVAAEEALAFEDSPPGLLAATRAGLTTVALATTRTEEDLLALGADLAVPDFTDPRLLTLFRS
ncbi:HAD family hydrolase [Falsirhodobacter sp. 20TX0035]|uniref:HAD family hydrolase n=1 Tax=Falsirhodobacter sp. 20TX0035 TaxID=3022019 RepID=UPI00232AEA71|nr:HAD family phosphatase [Falsirhodobacter sp. 20TX0035]MDB6454520.1 HAD family phosphatase [Falsirhodobacter sp. 20TX0035]